MYLTRLEEQIAEDLARELIGDGAPFGIDLSGLLDLFQGGRLPVAMDEFVQLLRQHVEDLTNGLRTLRPARRNLSRVGIMGLVKVVAICPFDTPEGDIEKETPDMRIATFSPAAVGTGGNLLFNDPLPPRSHGGD